MPLLEAINPDGNKVSLTCNADSELIVDGITVEGLEVSDVGVTSVPADPFGANADAASATGSISAKLRFIASTGIPVTGTVTVGLPTGASTAAKQPALGAAGTASSDVITVQGITSMTPLLVTASAGTNLNTSALALEAGGNLAAAATSLATLDNIVAGNEAQCDVLTLPSPISGPGNPTIDSYTSASVSAAANTANQSLIGTPGANKQIWVYGLVLTADTGDGSFSLQDEDDTAKSGVMAVAENGGFVINPSGNFAMPWFKVATNKALEIDTVTCGAKGIITYAIVSV